MSASDARYDASRKGRRRWKRREKSPARLAYRAKWMRAYRRRKKRAA